MSNQNNENKKYKLNYTEFEDFKPTMSIRATTTKELATLLNARLKPAFKDYSGCVIFPRINELKQPILTVTLSFNPLPASQISDDDTVACAFLPVNINKGEGNVADRLKALEVQNTQGKRFMVSQEAKDVFGPMIAADPSKINWGVVSGEKTQQTYFGTESYCYIQNIDFGKAMELIFGSKDAVLGDIFYSPVVTTTVTGNPGDNNWKVNLQMTTKGAIQDLCDEYGVIGGNANFVKC